MGTHPACDTDAGIQTSILTTVEQVAPSEAHVLHLCVVNNAAVTKYLTRCKLREEGLFCPQCCPPCNHSEEVPGGVWYCWPQCVHSQEAERDGHQGSAHFSLCYQVRVAARGALLPTFSMGLPSSVKPSQKRPPRHSQGCVS